MKLFSTTKFTEDFFSDSLWSPLPNFPVFGGEIVAQALYSAYQSLDTNSEIHSLHCYFLSPGNIEKKIRYRIKTNKQGKTITNKQIVAYQKHKIFIMSASFSNHFDNKNYAIKNLQDDVYEDFKNDIKSKSHFAYLKEFMNIFKGKRGYKFELKNVKNVCDTNCMIAFISDLFLLESGLRVLNENIFSSNVKMIASLDHTIHFHKVKMTNVLYFEGECTYISKEKALCIGYIYDHEKSHIATATQEGIIKLRDTQNDILND